MLCEKVRKTAASRAATEAQDTAGAAQAFFRDAQVKAGQKVKQEKKRAANDSEVCMHDWQL